MKSPLVFWFSVFAVSYFYATKDRRRTKSRVPRKRDNTVYMDEPFVYTPQAPAPDYVMPEYGDGM